MLDKILNLLSFFALLILIFLGGFAAAFFKVYPYEPLSKAFMGMHVAYKMQEADHTESLFVWPQPNAYIGKEGVTTYNAHETYGDYTLYSPSSEQAAYLIDMTGNVIHSWKMPFSKAFENPPHIEKPVKDNKIFWQGLHLFPNGDLLAVYYAVESSPAGYGVIKLDKDSNIIWKYAGYAHHDLTVDDEGNVYTLTQKVAAQTIPALSHLPPPIFDEYITVLSKDGEHLKDISIYKAFENAPHFKDVLPYLSLAPRADIKQSFTKYGDVIHPNAVSYISEDTGQFKAGQILLSLRETDMIASIDPALEEITWTARGFWRTQHSPVLNKRGNIVLFDNEGPQGGQSRSRVIEYNPVNDHIEWSYQGNKDKPLYSSIRSDVQPLPNDNILVTEYENGRIFEITKDKEIVWEFFTDATLNNNPMRIAGTHCAHRFTSDELPFLKEE